MLSLVRGGLGKSGLVRGGLGMLELVCRGLGMSGSGTWRFRHVGAR
jgi:hypothetical protein